MLQKLQIFLHKERYRLVLIQQIFNKRKRWFILLIFLKEIINKNNNKNCKLQKMQLAVFSLINLISG